MTKPQPHTENQRVAILYLLFCAALPFMYNDNGVDPVLIPRQLLLSALVLLLSALFVMHKKLITEFSVMPILMVLLSVAYLVSLAQPINGVESTYIILKILLFSSFALVMYQLVKSNMLSLTQISLGISISVIMALAWTIRDMVYLQLHGLTIFKSENMYKVNASFGHKNLLSSFLFLGLPMLGIQFMVTTKKWWKFLLAVVVFILLATLVLLQTRAVLLALFVCGFAAIILWLFAFSSNTSRLLKGGIVGSILVVLLGVFAMGYLHPEKLNKLTRTESFIERKNLWDNTWQMIQDHPITGVGAANWQIQMPKYGMLKFYEVNYSISEGLTNFQRPHNDFLWVWAETGVIGFVLYSLIFVLSLFFAFRLIKGEEQVHNKIIFSFLFVQVLGFMVISLVDFPLERIEHPVVIFSSIMVIAATYNKQNQQKTFVANRWIWILPLLVATYNIVVCSNRWKSETHLNKMYKAHASGNWQKLVSEGNQALTPYFNMDYYSIPVQWYIGVGYFMQNDLTNAKRQFEAAYQLHPYQVHVLNNYGACFEKEGNHTRAIELLEESHRLSPTFSDGIINLSGAYFNAGRYDDAYNTITQFKYDEQNERFKTFALAIIKVKLEEIIEKEKTTPFATYLKSISSNDDSILKNFQLAQTHNDDLIAFLRTEILPK